MDFSALTARCAARLADLDIPRPFDVAAFCAGVGRRRGRPLTLLGHDLPAGGPHGFCVSTRNADYIVYERATSPLHREHIILHEVSHLLCGHTGGDALDADRAGRLFPTLDPTVVARVLGRSSCSTEEEQEAELLASMILRAAHRRDRVPGRPAGDGLGRLEASM
ncbi:hypothetical protein [Actinophytocola sp.]|uniref:hypothetical protein n=1 Tax=Actinophytocola sp. TaxID=1872138 RepID=UPI00389A5C69